MSSLLTHDTDFDAPYISTGHLPSPDLVKALVAEAHARFKSNDDGENSQVYPALAQVPAQLFGICVVGTSGNVHAVGDTDHEFSIMSVSKPFLFALICERIGADKAREKLGANATGFAFNSVAGIERTADGRTNPMVNAGAIATTSLVPGATVDAKWKFIQDGLSEFAGRKLPMNDEVLASALKTNFRNRSIAQFLHSKLTPELQAQVDLDSINFISNDQLQTVLARTNATPAQVAEAVRVNTEARLRALKIGLLILAGLAMLAIIPASQLPNYVPGEIPDDQRAGRKRN